MRGGQHRSQDTTAIVKIQARRAVCRVIERFENRRETGQPSLLRWRVSGRGYQGRGHGGLRPACDLREHFRP